MSKNNALLLEKNVDGTYNLINCATADSIDENTTVIKENVKAKEFAKTLFKVRNDFEHVWIRDRNP